MSKKSLDQSLLKLTHELFTHLGFSAKASLSHPDPETTLIQAAVSPEESGVLIGYHGDTISALQLFLNLAAYHQSETPQRLVLNINDYRERRRDSLLEMAHTSAERVRATGQEVILPPLSSYDRRLIHLELADSTDVATHSIGEGSSRRLVISPKNA